MTSDGVLVEQYLRWNVINRKANYLTKAIVTADFEFYQKELNGQEEQKPRWKRAMAMTDNALGDAIGKMYCKKYFDASCKEKAVAIIENVRDALKVIYWIPALGSFSNLLKDPAQPRVCGFLK